MFRELLHRLISPTPLFFRKLRNLAIMFTGVSYALLSAPVHLPYYVTHVSGYVLAVCSVVTAICQLAKED